jgi:hypothetical protein
VRLYSPIIDSPLIFIHSLILPHIHLPLLHLGIEHLRILFLPNFLAVFLIFNSLFLRECVHTSLLKKVTLKLNLVSLLIIVILHLIVQALVDYPAIGRLALNIIDFSCFKFSQSLLLVEVVIVI